MLPPYPHYDKLYSRFVRPRNKRLSYEDRALLLYRAGFRGDALATMLAITTPESAGDPQAFLAYVALPTNPVKRVLADIVLEAARRPTPWMGGVTVITFRALCKKMGAKLVDVDIGLIQKKWWWSQEKYSMQALCDPKLSAELAFQLWQARAFQPWVAWQKGFHKKYLPHAWQAIHDLGLAAE